MPKSFSPSAVLSGDTPTDLFKKAGASDNEFWYIVKTYCLISLVKFSLKREKM